MTRNIIKEALSRTPDNHWSPLDLAPKPAPKSLTKSPQTPESESGRQGLIFYWKEMIKLSNESGVPLDKIERILFNKAR